jgi:hypothetical protein
MGAGIVISIVNSKSLYSAQILFLKKHSTMGAGFGMLMATQGTP